LSINKNGSRFTDGSPRVLTYNDTSATVALSVSSGPIPVTAGDYFELEFNVPDTSVTIVAARTNFSIRAVA
jgi:hypothetical protein